MSRILVVGSRGRLGAALVRKWNAAGVSRAQINVADAKALRDFLRSRKFTVLVNATGSTSLEACEDDPETARRVNVDAVAVMASEAARAGARLIHFSTDYVFDGTAVRPYVETDEARPLSIYGRTKLEGERAALEADPRHACFRVSWLFGPEKPAFPDTIVDRALAGQPLEAIADKTSRPTFADDVADWVRPFLNPDLPGGLYHACNDGTCTWLEYAQGALEVARALGWNLRNENVLPIRMAEVTFFRAPRPPNTPMSFKKLAETIGRHPRHWKEAFADHLRARSRS